MERYIELHLRESRQNQNADPVRHAHCSGVVALASGSGVLDLRPWMDSLPRRHLGGGEPVQQQSTAVSPLLSAVQRGFAHTNRA